MKLTTQTQYKGVNIEINNDNNTSIIANKVKITSKYKQQAQNQRHEIENTILNGIDKQAKKKAFYNKFKN